MRLIDADALTKECGDWYVEEGPEEGFIGTLEQLLSGQPEINCSEFPNNSDTISRQASLEKIRTMQTYKLFAGDDMLLIDQAEAQTELMMLPPAQPERPKGRWIPTASGKGRHECSRCHEYAPCYQDGSEHLSTFCVLCGAKMDGGEQE